MENETPNPTPWTITKHLIKQSLGPAGLALAYVSWLAISEPTTQSPAKLAGGFGVAYFFAMWFVGQYARVENHLRGRDQFRDLSFKFDHVIHELRQRAGETETSSDPASGIELQDRVAREILDEAQAAIQNGAPFAGLAAAGVAFDHAVRAATQRLGYTEASARNLHQAIKHIGRHVGSGIESELHALRETRNRFAHLHGEPPNLSSAEQIWQGYRWAVGYLDKLGRISAA